MDNREASMQGSINSNHEGDGMHGNSQDKKSIEEKLSESANVRGVSTTTSDQPVNIDDEKKRVSDQPTAQMPLQMESGSEFEGKDDQRDSPSPKSSANDDEHSSNSSSFVKVPESDAENSNGDYIKVSPAPGSDSGSSFEDIDNEDNNKNPQPVPLTPAPASEPTPVPLVPKPSPAPMPAPPMLSLSNKDDVQSNSRQPCTSGKNDPAPQNTKATYWLVVAASALAIAGIALGIALAVYLQMLAAGIVIGACCLVAATVIYYCAPKSSVENSKVEELCRDKTGKDAVIGS